MKVIQLQRQGVSETVKGYLYPDLRARNNYHFIEIVNYQGKFILGKVDNYINGIFKGSEHLEGQNVGIVRHKIVEYFKTLNIDVRFSSFIESYSFPSGLDKTGIASWDMRMVDDKYLTHCVYEPETDTIRHAIFNYCLVAFENGKVEKPIFNIDSATHHWDESILDTFNSSWIHDCDRKRGQLYCKGRLTWLLSEGFKEISRPEKTVKMPSLMQGHCSHKPFTELKEVTFK